MLEHLDRAGHVELPVARTGGSRACHRYGTRGSGPAGLAHPAWMDSSSRSIPTTRPWPSRCAHWCTRTPSPQPTSSSERGGRLHEELLQGTLEAGHQPPHDRVGRAVLVVGVPCDDPVLGDVAPPAAAQVAPAPARPTRAGSSASASRPGFVVGGGTPSCSSIRRTRSKVRWVIRRWAASRSPITPRTKRTTAAMNRTAPRIRDWTWPLPLPSDVGHGEADPDGHRDCSHQQSQAPEDPQGLVLRVDAEDRDRRCDGRRRPSRGTAATRGSWGSSGPGRGRRRPAACRPG